MVLAVPPLDESAIFTQIPLSEDLIPLDDLGASGGYGRQLILPDDVPPVLALPWALGPRLPRVNRAEDDGSLHVFVKGGSGLGGAPYKQSGNPQNSRPGALNQFTAVMAGSGSGDQATIGTINVLYGVQWVMTLTATGGVLGGIFGSQLYALPAQTEALDLFAVPVLPTSTAYPAASPNQSGFVSFGPGIDMAASFPGNAGFEWWTVGMGAVHGTLTITLYYS